jgi:hypothetical protein
MEQRSLRLGDIVDDYCPRERRVTNHAIVALVGNSIRQTRCSTCEAEHEYKEAKMPRKRTKGGPDGADLAGGMLVVPKAATPPMNDGDAEPAPVAAAPETNGASPPEPEAPVAAAGLPDENGGPAGDARPPDGAWLAHRPLIRATLPKTDGEPVAQRVIPEFTMHQRHGRGFGGRSFRHQHQGPSNGPSRNGNHHFNGDEPDGNRAPQAGRPGGGGAGGGRRRRRRRR